MRQVRLQRKERESPSQGAFTPDANDANRANDLHVKSMQRRERQSCGAIHAIMARIECFFARIERELKNLPFGGYLRR